MTGISVLTLVVLLGAVGAGRATMPARTLAPRTPSAGEPDRRTRWWHRALPARGPRPVVDAEVAAWCDDLARAVRGGSSLRTAIGDVRAGATIDPALRPLRALLSRGDTVADAVTSISTTAPTRLPGAAALDSALTVVRVAATVGGRVAETLDRTAAAHRERVAIDQERRAHAAPARLSALVLTAVPIVVLAASLLWSASARGAVAGPIGIVCVPFGCGTNLAGWWWMRRILRSVP